MYKAREFSCCLGEDNSQSFNHFYINTVKFKVLDLFAGIGGFTLGLDSVGKFETTQFVEIDSFCQKVLTKNWPNIPLHDDIRTYKTSEKFDIITGGFPCQDVSEINLTSRKGLDGEKTGLWSELHRLISDIRPDYAIMENVPGLLVGGSGRWFGRVLGDLAGSGYDAEWRVISAEDAGANHVRKRLWIVAYPAGRQGRRSFDTKQSEQISQVRHSERTLLQRAHEIVRNREWSDTIGNFDCFRDLRHSADYFKKNDFPKPLVCRGHARVSNRSHRHRVLGNSIVPQIAAAIGQAIIER